MTILFGVLIVGAYLGLGTTTAMGGFLFYYLLTAMRGLQGPTMRALLQNASERGNRAGVSSPAQSGLWIGLRPDGSLSRCAPRIPRGSRSSFSVWVFYSPLTLPWRVGCSCDITGTFRRPEGLVTVSVARRSQVWKIEFSVASFSPHGVKGLLSARLLQVEHSPRGNPV